MTIPSNLDGTLDQSLMITAQHVVGIAATGNSSATGNFNLGDVPADFAVHLAVYSTSTAVGDCAIVTVQGSTTADFSAGNHILGVTAFGAAAIINTTIGSGTTAARGAGDYVMRCHNVGYDSNGAPVNCRYIRTQVKTVGGSSAINYGAQLSVSR